MLYLDPKLEKTFVVVRIMLRPSEAGDSGLQPLLLCVCRASDIAPSQICADGAARLPLVTAALRSDHLHPHEVNGGRDGGAAIGAPIAYVRPTRNPLCARLRRARDELRSRPETVRVRVR